MRRRLALVAAAALLVGCPPNRELTLYNNDAEDLSVQLLDRSVSWPGHTAIRFGGEGGLDWGALPLQRDERGRLVMQLVVERRGRVDRYALVVPVGDGPLLDRSTGVYRVALQLQPDGRLYAVPVAAPLPAEPPPQPSGLPLSPLEPVLPP